MGKRILLTTWVLLASWAFFGTLEFAEAVASITESAAAEDATEQDLDQEALEQMASGIKPAVPLITAPSGNTAAIGAESQVLYSPRPHSSEVLHPPPLRLHQQLSVYRI